MSLFKANRWLATSILLAGTVASFSAFREIERTEQPKHLVVDGVELGEHKFVLHAGGTCFGELTTKLVMAASVTAMKATGHIEAQYDRIRFKTQFTLEGFFNPLGQLTQGRLSISGPGVEVLAQFRDVTPINVDLTVQLGDDHYAKNLNFPGPALLVERPQKKYGVSYAALPGTALPMLPLLSRLGPLPEFTVQAKDKACTITPLDLNVLKGLKIEDIL